MIAKSQIWKLVARALGLMILLLLLFQSVRVTVAWWQQTAGDPAWQDLLWVGSLPVWIAVYLRYFSIFSRECLACAKSDRGTE